MRRPVLAMTLLAILCAGLVALHKNGATSKNAVLAKRTDLPPPSAMTFDAPAAVSADEQIGGFRIVFSSGSRSRGDAGKAVSISAHQMGVAVGSFVPTEACGSAKLGSFSTRQAVTDQTGAACFVYIAPSNLRPGQELTVTANVIGETDALGNALQKKVVLKILQKETFEFIAPASDAIGASAEKSTPLHFRWIRQGSNSPPPQGNGKVLLAVDNGAQLVVDGSATGPTAQVEVAAKGDFLRQVGVYSSTSTPVTLTAMDQSSGRSASLTLSAADPPERIVLFADPPRISLANPDEASSMITAKAAGSKGLTGGARLTFSLKPIDPGSAERLSVYEGATSRNELLTKYSPGSTPGKAAVTACVAGSDVCSTVLVEVAN